MKRLFRGIGTSRIGRKENKVIEEKKKNMIKRDIVDMKSRNHLEQRHLKRLVGIVSDMFDIVAGIDNRLDRLENNAKEGIDQTIMGMGEAEKHQDHLLEKLEKLEAERNKIADETIKGNEES